MVLNDLNSKPRNTVVYLHGLCSSGQTSTAKRLRKALPEHEIISPDIPVNPEDAIEMLRLMSTTLDSDAIIVGTSMGACFAQLFKGWRRILVNPSFHTSAILRKYVGETLHFFTAREDGKTEFDVTEELCRAYEKMEASQFTPDFGIMAPWDGNAYNVTAFFGTHDNVVDCKEEYLSHYTDCRDFKGGHRLDPDTTLRLIVPEIKKMTL